MKRVISAVILLCCLICMMGCSPLVDKKVEYINEYNKASNSAIQQQQNNEAIARENVDVVIDFLAKGRYDDAVIKLLSVCEGDWYCTCDKLDKGNGKVSDLYRQYEKREGRFKDKPRWVFDSPIVIEDGYYIGITDGYLTQFIVIMGLESYKLVSKVQWKDGEIKEIERILYE